MTTKLTDRDANLGLAWYSREDWERGALGAIRELESIGRQIRKVPIDIEALVSWCRGQDRRIDSAARAEYVAYLLQHAKKDA